MEIWEWVLLLIAAFGAGFIDAIIGGGGLIQLPAVMFFLEGKSLPLIFGTNKLAGFAGTSVAAFNYARRAKIQWLSLLPAVCTALPAAYAGALAVKGINKETLKPVILVLFCAVATYTFFKKDFGLAKAKEISSARKFWLGILTGVVIGFYDGFFGPGTGSFLVFIYIILFGFEFLQASAHAKIVNAVTNIAALSFFIWHGDIDYRVAIPVAVMNIAGSVMGTRLAIKKGSGFIRVFFMIIVLAFIIKMGWDVFLK